MASGRRRFDSTRGPALLAGVILLAVPTFFTVIPGWTSWSGWWRGAVLLVWLIVAGVAVYRQTVEQDALRDVTADRAALLRYLRLTGLRDLLEALLRPGTRGIPEHYDFTLYRYVERYDELVAYWPTLTPKQDPDPRNFKPGRGATGTAWEEQQIVVVRGDDVSNEAYELTPIQQQFYEGYRSVASAVIWEENTRPIGVVTALSREDDRYFEGAAARDSLRLLAEALGVTLNRVPEPHDLDPDEA